jgi:hypothetical protein
MTVSQATSLKNRFPDGTVIVNDSLTNLTSSVITSYLTDAKNLRVDIGTSIQTKAVSADRLGDLIGLSTKLGSVYRNPSRLQ